jgi:uncharacterized protein YndB with AHSA1/START domain
MDKIVTLEKIIVEVTVEASVEKVWDAYTNPSHIINWNFADPSWHCPHATNELQIGGKYVARMEAIDGSFGFDFEAVYTEILSLESFTYEFGERVVKVDFQKNNDSTSVKITFDPETENPVELQKAGWQSILNNFKKYTETK